MARHVAILITSLGAGGAERVVAMLARHWVDQGHTISIITFDNDDDPIFHPLPEEVQLHRLGAKVGTGYRGNLKKLLRLRETLAEIRPEMLLSFLTKNNLLAALATTGMSTRLVCSERNNPERQGGSRLWNLGLKLAYRRAEIIVCQTYAIKRCFPEGVQDILKVIRNPITPFEVAASASDSKTICAVGRLTPQKGFDVLIEAFSKIADRHADWNLTIWGEGEIREQLEALVHQLGLESRVSLPGTTAKPGEWARDTTIFVQSSRYEGFGNALAEAVASGLPVVATDCDFGPSEMIVNGRGGLLVPCENASALAEAMSRMIEDKALRETCAAAARQSGFRFHPSNVLSQWDGVLNQLFGRAQGEANLIPLGRAVVAQNSTG